ncbi:allantoinase AllB [Pseudonocardia sp. KRD-184]|uniref:allantoinase n=1 Tax=Pseudonocardia oceani TaxID=2792013 RepID=A0ABS6U1S3_9PSEU|nr:allantoinase AllB [Pseudonocardia oceani]MBW0090454.1 allantoinase AllB [Pseudonocardia oceani]MBW0098237.1 allantoinase AllB [Pseudonocardia oceani]MBW0110197.1 allantoinase AllB [Pseudonocardia oceani]MBW0124236.1 allantoinase AllB [Pseudonocardia oceani]MBW0126180.1 allantoinase AllB [Pseudonocardia oceani]
MITVFRADRVAVDGAERPAAVVVEGERIVAVLPKETDVGGARDVLLGVDEVLLPGLVDTHVHVNEPGRTEWEGFATATRAAAAGGVTTIVDMPLNSLPPTVDVAALEVKRKAADGQCSVDVGFWGGAVPGNAGELRALHEAGVFGVKCFLIDSGVPEFPPLLDPEPALREVASFDGLLIAHAEDGDLVTAAHGRRYADFVASRPAAAEDSAIAGLLRAAAATGARVHVVHLSSASALPELAAARAAGVRVSVETCPHYLALTAEEVPDGDTRFKCCPPVRGEDNRDALWAGLADGTIDMVVSDHSPCTPDLKSLETGDFGQAWGGIASLQLGLPVVWTEARRRGHSLAEVVRWMAERPAALVGLGRKGRIAAGCDADLAVLAPDATFTVGELHHRSPLTPYAGRELHGVVRATWLRGHPVDGDDPRGRLLTRGEH